MSKPLVLITRPLEDAPETAQQVRAMGYDVLFAPALVIHDTGAALSDFGPDFGPDFDGAQGLIFPSAHAVRALLRLNPPAGIFSRTVFAVGEHTAQAARAAGFHDVRSGAGTMASLIPLIRQTYPDPVPLLYLSGADIRDDPGLLLPQSQGWQVTRLIVYRAVPADHIPADALDALKTGQVHTILFYSARSAESFLAALLKDWPEAGCATARALCLAPPVVDSLHKFHLSWAAISVSETPDQAGIMALLEAQEK